MIAFESQQRKPGHPPRPISAYTVTAIFPPRARTHAQTIAFESLADLRLGLRAVEGDLDVAVVRIKNRYSPTYFSEQSAGYRLGGDREERGGGRRAARYRGMSYQQAL